MRDIRKALAAVALGTTAALCAPAVASAAPVHSVNEVSGFTGFGTGRLGFIALSNARNDATAQIAAAGIQLNRCFEANNDVEFSNFSRLWVAESVWQCNDF
jgi:Spy/CpxP family protein refolding chaperone